MLTTTTATEMTEIIRCASSRPYASIAAPVTNSLVKDTAAWLRDRNGHDDLERSSSRVL